MMDAVVYFGAFLIAAALIGGVAYYFWRDKKLREKEQTTGFRLALLARLRKNGTKGVDFPRLAEQHQLPLDSARQAANEIYGSFCRKFVADAKITEAERKQLNALRHALTIPEDVAAHIERRAAEERYRSVAMIAQADGSISKEEAEQLAQVRSALGIGSNTAYSVVQPEAQSGYLALFRRVISDGRITPPELEELRRFVKALGMSAGEANKIIRKDALGLYRQWFYNIMQDGEVTTEEEQALAWLRDEFSLDVAETNKYELQLQEVKRQAAYRDGKLPSVTTHMLLESGEICHWEGPCGYQWKTATQTKLSDGTLVVTSDRLIFSSPLRSFAMSPAKIMDIQLYSDAVEIATAAGRGAGNYFINDPRDLEAILIGLVRKHKYHLSNKFDSDLSRHIPDSVRRDVWHRDGGRCVRCSAEDYLEYDHIIPHSKGGANTVANVQVLCRRCNNFKRDRI